VTVAELITALSTCDPNARVTASTHCQFEDDGDYLSGFDQVIEEVEIGFSEEGMEWDLGFTKRSENYRVVPTVRLVGHLDARLKD